MFDIICIFLLYAVQGLVQGTVFGALPLLLRRNPASTDVHQSQFTIVGYPFSIKFLIAPFIDGLYIARVGKRESWLLPLQLLCAGLLAWLSGSIRELLEATPPDVATLSVSLFVLVAATAAGDIATDAWAAGRMSDSRASVCQSIGLTVGFEFSATVFFVLMGKGLMDIQRLMLLMSTLSFAVLGIFIFQMVRGKGVQEEEEGDQIGVWGVLARIYQLVRGSLNFKIFLAFIMLVPILGGHTSLLAVRYQAAGFSPEIFAEYDMYLLPVSLGVMWLGGKISQTDGVLSALAWAFVGQALLLGLLQAHYWRVLAMGEAAVHDATLRTSYVVLKQLLNALDTILFVVKVSFFNRLAQRQEAIAGTIITFLASMSNLGGMLPGTLIPLLADKFGIDLAAAFCLTAGSIVLLVFWQPLKRVQDPNDAGWADGRVHSD